MKIQKYDLACGMPLVVETNDAMESVGLTWMLPLGSSCDTEDAIGTGTLLAEWMWRGAGSLDSRELSNALDRVGVQRSSSLQTHHLVVRASLVGSRLSEAIPILASMITEPAFPDDAFGPVRDLAMQSLVGLKDEPQQRSLITLKRQHLPTPFNRSSLGDMSFIESATPDATRAHWGRRAVPDGAILGLAGRVDGDAVVAQLNDLLASWNGEAAEPSVTEDAKRGYLHEEDPSAQVHIGVAYDAPTEGDPNSVLQRVATAVLSGGMAGRLFTEVREKRSLCYSVHASYGAGRDRGLIQAYSGTTPERAQETLDVMSGELVRLSDGVTPEEFQRAVVGLKSKLVMQGESTGARGAAIAQDHYILGRSRSLKELADRVDSVTLDALNAYLKANPPGPFTVVTVGPSSLTPPTR